MINNEKQSKNRETKMQKSVKSVVLVCPKLPLDKIPENIRKYYQEESGEPPFNLMYPAAMLDKEGIKVAIIDNTLLKLNSEKLSELILSKNPCLVGFSLMSPNFLEAKENIDILRIKINVPIVCGGPLCTIDPKKVINEKNIDFVIRGEGEFSLLKLYKAYFGNKNFKNISGLVYKSKEKIVFGPESEIIKDLDSLPFPDRHIINLNDYMRGKTNYVPVEPTDYIMTSRGCPFNCSFCASVVLCNRRYRYRSTKSVIAEMEMLKQKYGTKGLHFREDNFTANRSRVMDLCNEMIKRRLGLKWQCESRVDLLDEELVKKMAEAGCTGMWFGIESGSQKILDLMNKQITLEQVYSAVNLCKKYNMKIGASFIVGYPGETKADINKTFELAKRLKLDTVFFNQFRGFPGSRIYDKIIKDHLYNEKWADILFIKTSEFDSKEIYDLVEWFNSYFRMKRTFLVLKRAKFKEVPFLIKKGIRTLLNIFTKKTLK